MNRPGIGHVHIVDGTQGPVGKEGPEGKQGERGPIGLTGERGPIGLTGERGPAGEQGPIGPAGRSVQSWTVNGAGHLIVTYSDMTTADLGNVIGPRGPDGPQGVQGIAGPAGRSIYKVEVDSTNHLICTFSDNAVVDLGNVVGPRGPIGDKGEKGTTGATGRPSGLPYIFSTSIGEFDPGVGKLAINSASYTAASKLYVSATTQLGFAAAALLGSWDDATSKVRGILHVFEATNPGNFVAYAIVGSGSDNTGWFTYPVVHIDHGGVLTQDAILAVQFTRAGDKGDTGEKGDKGEQGDLGPTPALTWAFDPSSTDANPGSGKLRLNEPAIPMASVLLISNTEAYGANVAAWIDSLDDSSNTVTRGQLTLIQVDNPGKFAVFNVAGIVTDGSGFRRVPITHIASNGPLAGRVALSFNIAGNKGIDGEGGNVYAPPSGVADGHVALFDHDANHIRSGGPLGTLAFKSKVTGDDMAGKAVTVAQGGTGAATAEDARTNLGLHKVAATGSFKDLLDQPIPFDGQYASLSGRPDLGSASNRNVGIEAGNVPQVTDAGKIEGALVPPPAAGFFGGIKALAAAATKFVTGAGEDGVLTVAQPTFGDIGGTVQANQLPSPTVNDKGGVKALAAVAKKFLTGIGADGVPTAQQPAFTDLSGQADPAQLPNPTTAAKGGVKALAAVASKFLTGIGTDGTPTAAQPAVADISGLQGALDAKATLGTAARLLQVILGAGEGVIYTDGDNIVMRSGKGPNYKYAVLGVDGTLAALSGGVSAAGPITATGDIGTNGRLVTGIGQTSSYVEMRDTDEGTRWLHNNSGYIGFLGKDGGWKARVGEDGAWWTSQLGDLNGRIEARAAAFAGDRVAKAGDTMSGSLELRFNEPFIWLHSPNNTRKRLWHTNDGYLRWRDQNGADDVFRVGPGGDLWCVQLGDINTRIEQRAAAFVADRIQTSANIRWELTGSIAFNSAYLDIVKGGVLRYRIAVDGSGNMLHQNGDNGDNFFYINTGGAIWTKQFGDLNQRIEDRAYAYADAKLGKGGGTMTGDLQIQKAEAQLQLHYPNLRIWYLRAAGDGGFRISCHDGGERFYLGSGADIWTAQLGDLNTRIENRAAAYADDRLNTATARVNNKSLRFVLAGDLDNSWNYDGGFGEPYGGAVITSRRTSTSGTGPVVTGMRWRYAQMSDSNGSWYTCGYA